MCKRPLFISVFADITYVYLVFLASSKFCIFRSDKLEYFSFLLLKLNAPFTDGQFGSRNAYDLKSFLVKFLLIYVE